MHNASHLADDGDDRAMLMQGAQQRQRVEPDRVIGCGSSDDIVGVIMTDPAPFPAHGRLTQLAHSRFQSPDCQVSEITFPHLCSLPRGSGAL